MHDTKTKIKKERAIGGSVSGKKTKPDETGRDRNEGNRPGLIHGGKGTSSFFLIAPKQERVNFFFHYLFPLSFGTVKLYQHYCTSYYN